MSTINVGGGYESSSKSSQYWTLRDRLRNLTTALSGNASLDLRFINQYFYKKDDGADAEQSAALELFDAVCTRGSKGWYPEWDFTNGGVCGRLTEYDNNELRYGSQGLLEEASSTNHIRNPRAEGAVAGTPGTDPTHWSVGTFAGITKQVVSFGYENGWPYVDIRYNGSATGDCVIDFEPSSAIPALNGQTWTVSCGVKILAGSLSNISQTRLFIVERDTGGNAPAVTAVRTLEIDTSHRRFAGTHTLSGGGTTAYVQPRLSLDRVANGAIDITLRIYAPQLEQKSAPTSPILPAIGTPAASTRATETVTQLASISRASRKSNAGEWDFTNGGEVGTYREFLPDVPAVTGKGLLVEEGSVNHIRNPRAEGGTSSTLPTYWNLSGQAPTSYAYGTENGHEYIDLTYSAVTPSASTAIYFEGNTQIAGVDGQTFTTSLGARVVSGTLDNVSAVNFRTVEYTSGGSVVTAENGANLKSRIATSHNRLWEARTLNGGGTTAFFKTGILLNHISGSWTFTLRLYLPQIEQKAYPTSPILPPKGTLAASTRDADDVSIDIGAWFSSDNSSFYVSFQQAGEADGMLAYFSNGTFNERFQLRKNVSTQVNLGVWNSGTQTGSASVSGVSSTVGDTFKCAAAVAADDIALSVNGQTQVTDSTVTLPTGLTSLQLGFNSAGIEFNGYFKEFRYWPRRLTNTELESLVGNS